MTPAEWAHVELGRFFGTSENLTTAPSHRSLTIAELVADDAALLGTLLERLRESGAPRRAGAKYLSGWIGGAAAAAIGYAAVVTEGSFLIDAAKTTWRLHPEGWFDGVDLGEAVVVVAPGHYWSGLPRTVTNSSSRERAARAVGALVDTLAPVTTALRELGGVGLGGLWAEVGDGFGSPFLYRPATPVTDQAVAMLRELAEVPGAPWKVRPSLWTVEAAHGPVFVMQKGGCCLSYTEPGTEAIVSDVEDQLEFDKLFAEAPGAPRYCSTCRHRTREDVEARQLWWRAREHAKRVALLRSVTTSS